MRRVGKRARDGVCSTAPMTRAPSRRAALSPPVAAPNAETHALLARAVEEAARLLNADGAYAAAVPDHRRVPLGGGAHVFGAASAIT